jgi:hypothetical protein
MVLPRREFVTEDCSGLSKCGSRVRGSRRFSGRHLKDHVLLSLNPIRLVLGGEASFTLTVPTGPTAARSSTAASAPSADQHAGAPGHRFARRTAPNHRHVTPPPASASGRCEPRQVSGNLRVTGSPETVIDGETVCRSPHEDRPRRRVVKILRIPPHRREFTVRAPAE